ncbi:MAG: hypothetical protein M3345_03315 [Actinomycetota bacterium]|nr:hypothetical protein [Actinomycetota bacterium]
MTPEEAEDAIGKNIVIEEDFSDRCRYAHVDNGPEGLALMINDGRIGRIDIWGDIRTVSGVGVGDTDESVFDTYPGRIHVEPHPYLPDRGRYLVYEPEEDTHLGLIFETDRGVVTSFRSGLAEPVRYIEGCA